MYSLIGTKTRCSHTYRRWDEDTQSFIYGTCPYSDENFNFDELGNSTSKQNDACGKRLNDCVIRFQESVTNG